MWDGPFWPVLKNLVLVSRRSRLGGIPTLTLGRGLLR
jgi:hypothetical protein